MDCRSTTEYRYAAVTVATLGTINPLVDYTVDATVTAMHERHTVARRTSERNAHVVVTLVGELPEVRPPTDLQRGRQARVVLAAITSKLQLAHRERRIADAEIETVTITCVVVAGTRWCRIAIENRQQKGCVFGKLVFYPRADGRQRIRGSASRQIGRCNGWPIALQEDLAEIAVGIRGELTKSNADRSNPALQLKFGQSHSRCGFYCRNRIRAADIVSTDAAIIINSKRIDVEAPVLPAGKLFQINQKLGLQLALNDRALPDPSGHISQHVVGVDQIVRDAATAERFAVPIKISVVRAGSSQLTAG